MDAHNLAAMVALW